MADGIKRKSGRPFKDGMPWVKQDTDIFSKPIYKLIRGAYGDFGTTAFLAIERYIGKSTAYFFTCTEQNLQLAAADIFMDCTKSTVEKFAACIKFMTQQPEDDPYFDSEMYEKFHVITKETLQSRWMDYLKGKDKELGKQRKRRRECL